MFVLHLEEILLLHMLVQYRRLLEHLMDFASLIHLCFLFWSKFLTCLSPWVRLTLLLLWFFCSAGIGRTGTIVVIDMIIETIDTLGNNTVKKYVLDKSVK